MPFPNIPSTQHFRNTWIIKNRIRPQAPMFMGAPAPSKRENAAEHSAMLTMAYFHLWTLRAADAEGDIVPYAGCLRAEDLSWEEAIKLWLDGNVISHESARYVSNFLSVYRARPRDPNEDAQSDENFSDEELIVDEEKLEHAMKTRVGGREVDNSKTKKRK